MYSLGGCSDHRQKKSPCHVAWITESSWVGSYKSMFKDFTLMSYITKNRSKLWSMWLQRAESLWSHYCICFYSLSKALRTQEDCNYFLLRKYCLCQSRAKYTQMSVWPHLLFCYLNSLPWTFGRQLLGLQCILTKCAQRNKMYSHIKFHISKSVWLFFAWWSLTVISSDIYRDRVYSVNVCLTVVYNDTNEKIR